MATKVNATTEINTMKTATYGKDMRQAIVDVTEKVVNAVNQNVDDLAGSITKVNGVESGAQVNKIENIAVGAGSNLTISSKKVTIPNATASVDGAMAKADKAKLDGIASGAQVNVLESLAIAGNSGNLAVSSKKITLPLVTTGTNGLMSAVDYMRLLAIKTLTDTITKEAWKDHIFAIKQDFGWEFIKKNGSLVYGPRRIYCEPEDLDKGPVLVLTCDKDLRFVEDGEQITYTATIYLAGRELTENEFFLWGCRKWKVNGVLQVVDGKPVTSKTLTVTKSSSLLVECHIDDGRLEEGLNLLKNSWNEQAFALTGGAVGTVTASDGKVTVKSTDVSGRTGATFGTINPNIKKENFSGQTFYFGINVTNNGTGDIRVSCNRIDGTNSVTIPAGQTKFIRQNGVCDGAQVLQFVFTNTQTDGFNITYWEPMICYGSGQYDYNLAREDRILPTGGIL